MNISCKKTGVRELEHSPTDEMLQERVMTLMICNFLENISNKRDQDLKQHANNCGQYHMVHFPLRGILIVCLKQNAQMSGSFSALGSLFEM